MNTHAQSLLSRTTPIATLLGVAGIIFAVISQNIALAFLFVILPFAVIFIQNAINRPIVFLFFIFVVNYFIMAVSRYIKIDGVSVLMDSMWLILLILLLLHTLFGKSIAWKDLNNILILTGIGWMVYCFMEIANPTAHVEAWFSSKSLMYNGLLVPALTILVFTKREYVQPFIFMFSLLVLAACVKTLVQKYVGFDATETAWLNAGASRTHIIHSGIRYFSFFTDASNMGSNMGYGGFLFCVIGLFSHSLPKKIYYIAVGLLSTYAMFLSGTRGAMIVPLGGIAAYTILSKNTRAIVAGSLSLFVIYVFFVFTTIGQGNAQIRRMRTAFNPTKDASYIVRKQNQARLAAYLKNKPFGEGLGLSGGENLRFGYRLTTSIPNDSWLVKIWVETGIIGITLYMTMMFLICLKCTQIIMFRIQNKEYKALCIGLLGGNFGLILSSYGNSFFGQYPTYYIVYIGFAIIFNYKYLDDKILVS